MIANDRVRVQVVKPARYKGRVFGAYRQERAGVRFGRFLSAVTADAAVDIVGVAERGGLLTRDTGGERIGGANRLVVDGAGDQDRPGHLAVHDDLAEEAVVGAVELLREPVVGKRRLEQGQGVRLVRLLLAQG